MVFIEITVILKSLCDTRNVSTDYFNDPSYRGSVIMKVGYNEVRFL